MGSRQYNIMKVFIVTLILAFGYIVAGQSGSGAAVPAGLDCNTPPTADDACGSFEAGTTAQIGGDEVCSSGDNDCIFKEIKKKVTDGQIKAIGYCAYCEK